MKNISSDQYGWRVKVMRNGITFDSFVRFGADREAARRKAICIRDEYLATCAAMKGRSNTGVAGITEVFHWSGGKPRACFQVTFGGPRPNWIRRFFFKTLAERQTQLVKAIRHRARIAGENFQTLMEAAYA